MSIQTAKPPRLIWKWLAAASVVGALSGVVLGFIAYVLWPWDVMIDHNAVYLAQAWLCTSVMHFVLLLIGRFTILPFLPYRELPFMFAVAGGLAVIALMLLVNLIVAFFAGTAFEMLQMIWLEWTYPGSVFPRLIFALGVAISGLIYARLTTISGSRLRALSSNR